MNSSTSGLGITTSRKIVGGRVVEEKVVQLPTIEEIRENLSYRGNEDKSFRWRGETLAYGEYDHAEKVYSISNPVFSGMQFPTWREAFDFIDAEKEAIATELEKLTVLEEAE